MNEMKPKKLSLNRETIRNLSDESLEQVAGGRKKGGGGDNTGLLSNCGYSGVVNVSCHSGILNIFC